VSKAAFLYCPFHWNLPLELSSGRGKFQWKGQYENAALDTGWGSMKMLPWTFQWKRQYENTALDTG